MINVPRHTRQSKVERIRQLLRTPII
jgi:hypothetical protein